ncbi:MAG: CoA-binding protein [Deltaproteobacteria bacterium]|nr:MAG: CoA-binding protein [Deltaproteobacteria bacterium]
MPIVDSRDARRQILERTRRIAVLGATPIPMRAGFYVPEYLAEQGYEVTGVNPVHARTRLFGREVVATLAELEGPVDMVDVFRRSEALPEHLDELLAVHPDVVWFQQGIRHDAVARALSEAGITVVQDRCTLADHRSMGLPRVSSPE